MAKWIYKKYSEGYTDWGSEEFLRRYNWTSSTDYIYLHSNPPDWTGSRYRFSDSTELRNHSGYRYGTNSSRLETTYEELVGDRRDWTISVYGRTRSYAPGSYIGEVVAEDGTYPNNGLHSDGYYYIKDRQAFPEMWVNINGTNRKAEAGWVNVNGTWRSIEEIYVKVNGVWRKSE